MKTKVTIPEWIVGALITLVFLFVTFTGIWDFTDVFERKAYDLRARMTAQKVRNPAIELVVISERDLAEFGPLPWRGDIIAQVVNNLSLAGARVIAFNIPFRETAENLPLKTLNDLKKSYERLGLVKEGPNLSFYHRLVQALAQLDHEKKLYTAMKEAGNVVLPVHFDVSTREKDKEIPEFVPKNAIKNIKISVSPGIREPIILVSKMEPIPRALAQVAAAIGFDNIFPQDDGRIRDQVHVLRYQRDIHFPSLAIAIAKVFFGIQGEGLGLSLGKNILLKRDKPPVSVEIPVTGPQMRSLIKWNRGPGAAFHRVPISKVLKNEIATGLFKNKIAIIGTSGGTPPGLFETPLSRGIPALEIIANSVENILDQRFLSRPDWSRFLELGILVLFGLFLTLLLPRMDTSLGIAAALGLALLYGITGFVSFVFFSTWVKVAPPIMMLLFGGLVIILVKRLSGLEALSEPVAAIELTEVAEPVPEETAPKPALRGFKLGEELGRGTLGKVYRAVDPKTDRVFAVKTIHLGSLPEDIASETKERLISGVRSAKLLKHPNIVRVFGYGSEAETLFIVMTFVEGRSLGHYVQKDRLLPLREALSVCGQVAEGLEYAHGMGIVHGNIKPTNIILDGSGGIARITDFGMVNIAPASGTKPDSPAGLPLYMSPEQVLGKKIDGRSDVFSLGVVLYQLLCHVNPFASEDINTIMRRIVKDEPISVRRLNPSVPSVVEMIMAKVLQKDPDKRYQRSGLLAEHIKKVVQRIDEISERNRGGAP
ncbi:MAG: CHASE2 domain-containing protein [Deltaproteobacteria bacterium]|nr:CHASE2 domain-containing protein [Deltaproteobacteria bacterium]MBW2137598.1 CHASE2 domain-containing protein [Deltaproteobacteria bacterium]